MIKPPSGTLSRPTACTRFGGPALLLMLLACPACGLADYEQKMTEAQARQDRIDEDNRKLGPPLELPEKLLQSASIKEDVAPPQLFYRPPREISSTCKNPTRPINALVYQYPRHPGSPEGASVDGQIEGAVLTDLYLAMAPVQGEPEASSESFGRDVLRNFPASEDSTIKQQRVITPPGCPPMVFSYQGFRIARDPRASYIAYFIHKDGFHLALLYRLEGKNAGSLIPLIERSLELLALMGDVPAARRAYEQSRPPGSPA